MASEKKINVLLLGSGGREHALAWKLAQSPLLGHLYIAPGNPGTSLCGTNIAIQPTDFEAVKKIAISLQVDLVVVGPEEPLVKGLHDFFLADIQLQHIPVIGPCKHGAMLEGSKDFAKQFMQRHAIPTAAYRSFTIDKLNDGIAFLNTLKPPYVLKADGLAAGKGVVICQNYEDAVREFSDMLQNRKFGQASETVVIEEFLDGIELSVFVLTDGKNFVLLPEAKDYKRVGEADTGPNTGGMGSISPVPFANQEFMQKVENKIIKPTIKGLVTDNIPYIGFIFFGLMNVGGNPFVIEYNVRLGDPETESVILRIQSDLLLLLIDAVNGNLMNSHISIDDQSAACVMLVSGGYPGTYSKGKQITIGPNLNDAVIFHAGTTLENGNLISSGGRVAAVSALGNDLASALKKSYLAASSVHFEDMYFRRDLGFDLQ